MGWPQKGKLKIINNLQPLQHFIMLERLLYFHEGDPKVKKGCPLISKGLF